MFVLSFILFIYYYNMVNTHNTHTQRNKIQLEVTKEQRAIS